MVRQTRITQDAKSAKFVCRHSWHLDLGGHARRCGLPARHVLELVLGDLAKVEKPLPVGIVMLTVVWVIWRQVRNHGHRA
jgi:hypothetical protein